MLQEIEALRQKFREELDKAASLAELEPIRVAYLGKKGPIQELMKGLKDMTDAERREAGQLVNTLKSELAEAIVAKGKALEEAALVEAIRSAKKLNPSLRREEEKGSFHPITLVAREVEEIFASMGFAVEDYSEIVDDYHCFEALNIPKHHPARDMQDTYYLENGQLLKTHTSAAQN